LPKIISAHSDGAIRKELPVCVPRTSSGVLKVKPGNIGDEGGQEQVVFASTPDATSIQAYRDCCRRLCLNELTERNRGFLPATAPRPLDNSDR
jgi:hypothetical protein